MGKESKIEWTDATWNPVRGCIKVSQGCKNCYAATFAERFRGVPGHPFEQGFDLRLVPHKLGEPKKWKEPKRIFVNSLSDLFIREIGELDRDYVKKVFQVMAETPQHTYQILTKRPANMLYFCKHNYPDPLPNVWLGTSVENADVLHRIDTLRDAPAALRFLSIEPLLGPLGKLNLEGIGWVIVGGESGPGARPMHPDWVREIRDQCQAAGVPFFFKQWGEWISDRQLIGLDLDLGPAFPAKQGGGSWPVHEFDDHTISFKIGKKRTGRLLDRRQWDEMPGGKNA